MAAAEVSDRERAYLATAKELADGRDTMRAQIASLHRALDASARHSEAHAAAFSDVIVAQALRRIADEQADGVPWDLKTSSPPGHCGVLVPEAYTRAWPAAFRAQVDICHDCTVTMTFTSTEESYTHRNDDWEFGNDEDAHVVVHDDDDVRYAWRNIIIPWEFWENAGQFWLRTWPSECHIEEDNCNRYPLNRLTIKTQRLALVRGGLPPPGPPAIVEDKRE